MLWYQCFKLSVALRYVASVIKPTGDYTSGEYTTGEYTSGVFVIMWAKGHHLSGNLMWKKVQSIIQYSCCTTAQHSMI